MTLGVALFVVAILYFCIISPGFRKLTLAVVGISIVLFIAAAVYVSQSRSNSTPAVSTPVESAKPSYASAADLEITDIRVNTYEVIARIKNTSDLYAPRISGDLVALDCRSNSDCEVSGRASFNARDLGIPGGESAQLRAPVSLRSIAPAKYRRAWRVDLYDPE